jgi:hypothetical protein
MGPTATGKIAAKTKDPAPYYKLSCPQPITSLNELSMLTYYIMTTSINILPAYSKTLKFLNLLHLPAMLPYSHSTLYLARYITANNTVVQRKTCQSHTSACAGCVSFFIVIRVPANTILQHININKLPSDLLCFCRE